MIQKFSHIQTDSWLSILQHRFEFVVVRGFVGDKITFHKLVVRQTSFGDNARHRDWGFVVHLYPDVGVKLSCSLYNCQIYMK